jgi:hypothetical protein
MDLRYKYLHIFHLNKLRTKCKVECFVDLNQNLEGFYKLEVYTQIVSRIVHLRPNLL